MTAFADHNKDYIRANYNTSVNYYKIYKPRRIQRRKPTAWRQQRGLNLNLNRNKQAELDALVNTRLPIKVKPAATHPGSP